MDLFPVVFTPGTLVFRCLTHTKAFVPMIKHDKNKESRSHFCNEWTQMLPITVERQSDGAVG